MFSLMVLAAEHQLLMLTFNICMWEKRGFPQPWRGSSKGIPLHGMGSNRSSLILVLGIEALVMRDSETLPGWVTPLPGVPGRVFLAALVRLDPQFKDCTCLWGGTSFYWKLRLWHCNFPWIWLQTGLLCHIPASTLVRQTASEEGALPKATETINLTCKLRLFSLWKVWKVCRIPTYWDIVVERACHNLIRNQ